MSARSRFSNIMNPNAVHNRTLRSYCTNVQSSEGYVRVKYDGLPSQGRPASIPWLWASFPEAAVEGGKRYGAWGRYIPFEGDLFKMTFDYNDKIHILGYDTKYYGSNTSANQCGWSQITESAAGDDPLLLSQFRILNSGEYDFMSIGGAYVFGSNQGTLHLEGGPAQIDLDKSTNSISGLAQAWKLNAQLSTIRYGQVRRFSATPAGIGDIAIPPWNLPDGSYIEHQILLQNTLAGAAIPMVRHAIGNVTTNPVMGGGIPDISTTTGQVKRFALDIYDATGALQVYNDEVDMLGSQSISAPTATQFNVSYPLGTVKYDSMSSAVTTVADAKMTTGTTFDVVVGTAYSLSTTTGDISMTAAINFSAIASVNMSLSANLAMSVGGATLSLSGGGTSISMMGGGIIKMGSGASPAVNFNQLSQAFTAAQNTFTTDNPPLMTTLGAITAPALTGTAVVTALAAIIAYINSVSAAVNASINPKVTY